VRITGLVTLAVVWVFAACSGGAGKAGDGGPMGTPDADAATGTDDVVVPDGAFCKSGDPVPGVTPPSGFCLRRFAAIGEPRTLVVAPNGDVIVGAPSAGTPGGASGGPGAIVVLADDDGDGVAEQHTFAGELSDVHGLALGGGHLYFTTQATVWRTPYTSGQRMEAGPREDLGMPARFGMGGRWTHGLARSVGGTLYASRGEYATCGMFPGGEISSVAVGGSVGVVASGFRNPMYMRCHPTEEVCAAAELGEDLAPGAREKIVMLRPDTTYGYPCCHDKDLAASGATAASCAEVKQADAEFPLSETPFGLDWERQLWPEPYAGAMFVALHGSFYSSPVWAGARIVFAKVDPTTRMPSEAWQDFLLGFGPQGTPLERPADVAFSPDGRLFFADDQGDAVYWMAPVTLLRPASGG
jgi:glucose/arabinose dehydrogenase